VLVVWSIKKLAPESIQPAPDYGEVSAVHMPEQRWVIDLLFAFRVEHELGIGKLNFYSPPVSLMNKLPHRFYVGWGEIWDRVHGIFRRIEMKTGEKAAEWRFCSTLL
tara:strand:+ start:617 stop:937 length:321 start_codon:yes stop_codon:yes gene_type:complete